LTCVIESDGKDIWEESIKRSPADFEIPHLINIIAEAGIVGLGGAAFTTHVKISPHKEKPIETLIINGCESEPYLTADHRVMVENTNEIIEGAKIVAKIVNAKRITIAIENNKPDAIAKMKQAIKEYEIPISVATVKTKYPQGAENQLIKTVLGIQVPSCGLPIDVKALVQNIQTCYAIYEAVIFRKPLVEKVITVTGQVKEPKNLRVRIGTPIRDLVNFCGGYSEEPQKVILGGPMMGIAQFSDELPIIKGTLGVLILGDKDVKILDEQPCIHCARCVNVCPMNLLPCTINDFVRHKNFDRAQEYNLFECIECGCCAYICPSQIQLVHAFKFAKNEVRLKVKQ
jgi:electron transport complex protein RnfC